MSSHCCRKDAHSRFFPPYTSPLNITLQLGAQITYRKSPPGKFQSLIGPQNPRMAEDDYMIIYGILVFSSLNCLPGFYQETIKVNPVIPHPLILPSQLESPLHLCHPSLRELTFSYYPVCLLIFLTSEFLNPSTLPLQKDLLSTTKHQYVLTDCNLNISFILLL